MLTLGTVKRRFLRQNREFAKCNSAQSMRIRCLEAEVSRLLTENLGLREEIINLRNDLENAPSKSSIQIWRDTFEDKIKELQGLLGDIDELQKPLSEKKKDGTPKRSPEPRDWRSRFAMDDDNRLPTIREDKYYPRRTMDADEIRSIDDNASESPDLGPPPVAHFDEDPIKFDPQPTADPLTEPEPSKGAADMIPAPLSINLETRRKRREGGTKLEIRRMSVFQSPEDGSKRETAAPPIRAGAKRKLSARDDGSTKPAAELSSADFEFSRKSEATSRPSSDQENEGSSRETTQAPANVAETKRVVRVKREKVSESVHARRALGESKVTLRLICLVKSNDLSRKYQHRSSRVAEEDLETFIGREVGHYQENVDAQPQRHGRNREPEASHSRPQIQNQYQRRNYPSKRNQSSSRNL
jgi:Shugoshin N-terminal coiled-coil region